MRTRVCMLFRCVSKYVCVSYTHINIYMHTSYTHTYIHIMHINISILYIHLK